MTARPAPKAALDSFTEIATLRIDLNYSDPPIWRLVEVPTSITLKVLHDIVQVAMGWTSKMRTFCFHVAFNLRSEVSNRQKTTP